MRVFATNEKRDEKLQALNDLLECGSEDDCLELLVGWGVPGSHLATLLDEFRRHRREKRGLL